MRLSTALWIGAFVLVCGSLSTVLKTAERVFVRFGGSGTQPQISQQTIPITPLPFTSSGYPTLPTAASPDEQHREALKLITAAKLAQQTALGHIERWDAEVLVLLEEGAGEPILANAELVEKLARIVQQDRSDAGELHAASKQLDLLHDRVRALSEKSPPGILSAREMYEIHQLHSSALVAETEWDNALKHAKAIVIQAHWGTHPVAEPTLGQRLQHLEATTTLENLENDLEAVQTAKTNLALIGETPTNPIDVELRTKALSPEVQSVLAPFLEPRSIQPSLAGRFSIKFTRTAQAQPMSLGKLMSIGALHPSEIGLKKLALIGGNRKLPEPKWSISSQPHGWGEDDAEFLAEAQQMLRDYGAVLVQEGLLSR